MEMATPGTVEGTLEVCYDKIWGLISQSGWSTKDAMVACQELGYIGAGVQKNCSLNKFIRKALLALCAQTILVRS